MKNRLFDINADFKCIHCRHFISANPNLSGVVNRNHCPYCLYSRHLDLHAAGDRLSACKSQMEPVGLTLKKNSNKYGKDKGGELMLIHRCTDCDRLSINRIAADDDAETVFGLFGATLRLDNQTRARLESSGILILQPADADLVHARLFGWRGTSLVEAAGEPAGLSLAG
jgi:hypothetical protein